MKEERQLELLPMSDIHAFAMKWLEKFKDLNTESKELTGQSMGEDCSSIGFKIDSGQAFSKRYGEAFGDSQVLREVIDGISDIMLLGSAIYSAWDIFSHWDDEPSAILKLKNREWFILALDRLKVLTGDEENIHARSIGKIQRIKIHSNSVCMQCPQPEDEVEQHLTITRDGRIFFSSYVFGKGFDHFKRVESKNFKIDKDRAELVMTALEEGLSTAKFDQHVFDAGIWTAEVTNETGNTYKFKYALIGGINTKDGTCISDIVREELGMPGLYVFDSNCENSEKTFHVKQIHLSVHNDNCLDRKRFP